MVTGARAEESKDVKIKRALSAAPANVASRARIADMDDKGNLTVLRDSDNGFTCVAGHLDVVGDPPACMDAEAMQWVLDWMAHKPRPTNTKPGIIYQLAGATDWSASDPWATSGTVHVNSCLYALRAFWFLIKDRALRRTRRATDTPA